MSERRLDMADLARRLAGLGDEYLHEHAEPGEPQRGAQPEGTWPAGCVQRAFVDGAKWWQFHKCGSTAFPSERDEMESEAVRRYGEPAR